MHVRCPHCQNPIDLVQDAALHEVVCPSCGSSFNLIADASTVTYGRDQPRTLAHFELLEQVGVGAFGSVWKARDSQLDRTVAVKIPRREKLDEADADQFLREARAAAQLRHPNIVSVHEVGRHDGTLYIASDFVAGATLAEWIASRRLSPREAAELCIPIAEALQHAHEHGVVHRDLKPSNIMLDLNGRPFLTDFGLAKREAGEITMTVEGRILGTPAYMPPEQARGEAHQADARSDIYSLGVILFELLTGERPFRGSERMLIVQILKDEPPSPRRLNGAVPRDLETITLKCLEKDPPRRYQSGSEVAAELRRYLAGEPIIARPLSRIARMVRWAKRQPVVAGLTAAVAASLMIGTIVASYFAMESRRQAEEAVTANERATAVSLEARRNLYVSQLNLAQAAWEDSRVGRVIELLDSQKPQPGEPDLRGFEWHYWHRLCRSYQLSLKGDGSSVESVAFSPDGRRLASAGANGTVKVWDVVTEQTLLKLMGHNSVVTSVTFSPDGLRLASASFDDTVKVWDTKTGTELFTLSGCSVTFNPNGRQLASGHLEGTVKIWDATTGQELYSRKGASGSIGCVAFSPDGRRLASAEGDCTVKVWDVANGKESLTFAGHSDAITNVAFSPDGRRLASASYDQTVNVWDATTGAVLLTLRGQAGVVNRLSFSPNGWQLATAHEEGTIKFWDSTTGQELSSLKGHDGSVNCVSFSPDGRRLASAGYDQTVKVWNAASGQESLALKGHTDAVSGVAFSPDGRRLASAGIDMTIKLWDAASGWESLALIGHSANVHDVSFSPDGLHLASASFDGSSKIWDASTGREERSLRGNIKYVTRVAYSPDGQRLATAGIPAMVEVWNAATGEMSLTLKGHAGSVDCVAFSPNGQRLVSGSFFDATIKVWDAATGAELLTLNGQPCSQSRMFFTLGGRQLATANADGTVTMWHATTGESLHSLKGPTGNPACVEFSPDGQRIASASGRTVKVWDALTEEELLVLKGHSGAINGLAFSRDGRRLASASEDGTIRIWDADTVEESMKRKRLRPLGLWDVSYYGWKASGEKQPPPDWQQVVGGKPIANLGAWDIDYSWADQPPVKDVPADHFAAVATGKFELAAGTYELSLRADDGARVFVNGKKTIDIWTSPDAKDPHRKQESTAVVDLPTGTHEVRIEYFELTGPASLQFRLRPQ